MLHQVKIEDYFSSATPVKLEPESPIFKPQGPDLDQPETDSLDEETKQALYAQPWQLVALTGAFLGPPKLSKAKRKRNAAWEKLRNKCDRYAALVSNSPDSSETATAGQELAMFLSGLGPHRIRALKTLSAQQLNAIFNLFWYGDEYVVHMMVDYWAYGVCLDQRVRAFDQPGFGDAVAAYMQRLSFESPEYERLWKLLNAMGPKHGLARSRGLVELLLRQGDGRLLAKVTVENAKPLFTKEQVGHIVQQAAYDKHSHLYFLQLLKKFAEMPVYRDWALDGGGVKSVLTVISRDHGDLDLMKLACKTLRGFLQGPGAARTVADLVRNKGMPTLVKTLSNYFYDVVNETECIVVLILIWLDRQRPLDREGTARKAVCDALLGNPKAIRQLNIMSDSRSHAILVWLAVERPDADLTKDQASYPVGIFGESNLIDVPRMVVSLRSMDHYRNIGTPGITDMVRELIERYNEL